MDIISREQVILHPCTAVKLNKEKIQVGDKLEVYCLKGSDGKPMYYEGIWKVVLVSPTHLLLLPTKGRAPNMKKRVFRKKPSRKNWYTDTSEKFLPNDNSIIEL